MNLRWQTLLAIVPIFLAVGVISGWLRIRSEESELLWGLRERGQAIAVGVAAHAGGARWFSDSEPSAHVDKALEDGLKSVLDLSGVRQVYFADVDGKRILMQRAAPFDTSRTPLVVSEAVTSIRNGPFTTDIFRDRESGDASLYSYAQVLSPGGEPVGMVGIETSAIEYEKQWGASLRQTLAIGLAVVALGVVAAMIVSGIIRSRVERLTAAVRSLVRDQYDLRLEPGIIREINDLGSTFNTLGSVLGEIVSKTKRSLIEVEQYRTEEDLRSTYRDEFYPPQWKECGTTQFIGCVANEKCIGDFFEIIDVPDGVFAVLGRISAGNLTERMTCATAASALSRELIANRGPVEAWKGVCELFPLSSWICVHSERATSKISSWRFQPEVFDLLHEETEFSLDPLLFHTLSEEAVSQIKTYMRCIGPAAPLELCAELAPLLRSERQGALLIVGDL